jgi:hypothetical protein
MTIPWKSYWALNHEQIDDGLAKWREHRFARIQLADLQSQVTPSGSPRKDLYGCVTVTYHGAQTGTSGKRHLEALAQHIAPMLVQDEVVRVCVRGKDTTAGYLEFS